MNNWVVQDSANGSFYEITMSGGILNLISATTPFVRNPIILDTDGSGIYWQLYSINGILDYNTVISSGSGDSVYMYDSVLGQWFIIFISGGIQGETLSNSPISILAQPVIGGGAAKRRKKHTKLYKEFEMNGKKYSILIKRFNEIHGKKGIKEYSYFNVNAKKLVKGTFENEIVARTSFEICKDFTVEGTLKNNLFNDYQISARNLTYGSFEFNVEAIREIENGFNQWWLAPPLEISRIEEYIIYGSVQNNIEQELEINGKRDITSIIEALDLEEL